MAVNVIHITGASGAGTTTLGKAISTMYGYVHLDTDDFFWEPTDPPYLQKREISKRQALLKDAIDHAHKCVISGSLTEWGDLFIPSFDLILYVCTPTEVRLKRLQERELQEFGDRILPGGDMFEDHQAFLKYAQRYDSGGMDIRSALHHREWLKLATCPVISIDGTAADGAASIAAML